MLVQDLTSIVASVLIGVGGGAALAVALLKWLGGVSAARILESRKAANAREQELLIRRRNVYTKLAVSMRVFLNSDDDKATELRGQFLAAYDEAVLWAPDSVLECLARFLDTNKELVTAPQSVSQQDLRAAYEACITAMRRDSGFPKTHFKYRFVTF